MTPIEIAETFEASAKEHLDRADTIRNAKSPGEWPYRATGEAHALAARCIRACIEGAKEENWNPFINHDSGMVSRFKTIFKLQGQPFEPDAPYDGPEFFRRALGGEEA